MSDAATIAAVQDLTLQTTNLHATFVSQRTVVANDITAAVELSQNETLPHLYSMAGNQIETVAAVFQLINNGQS